MQFNRRTFLKSSSLVALGLSVPGFIQRTAFAAPDAAKKGGKQTILVIVELNGGNDGLNTVIPFKDAEYSKLRPTLAQPVAQMKKLTDEIALHPNLGGLADLYQQGVVAVVQGVGYPNPDQSHFRSMDIWQAASTAENLSEGWLGKALKKLPANPSFHLKGKNEKSPLAYDGAPVRVPSIGSLEEFQLQLAASSGADKKAQQDVIEKTAKPGSGNPPLLDFVQQTATSTYNSSKRLQEIGKNYQAKATYPATDLANKLKLAAQLISADLGSRLFYVSLGGFDTHSGQAAAHGALMQELGDALKAFYTDMAAQGHKDRLTIMTFSEFGRRAKENGSRGTDHGSGAPMFVIGGKVKGGVIGAHPSLTQLETGNLKHHTDFRQVYAPLLDKWLEVSSKDVLGSVYKPVEILKS